MRVKEERKNIASSTFEKNKRRGISGPIIFCMIVKIVENSVRLLLFKILCNHVMVTQAMISKTLLYGVMTNQTGIFVQTLFDKVQQGYGFSRSYGRQS